MQWPQWRFAVVGLALLVMYTSLAASAVAIFIPQVQMSDMRIQTANIELLVSGSRVDYPPAESFSQEINIVGPAPLEAGEESGDVEFWIWNRSLGINPLDLRATLSADGQDWELLKQVVMMRLVDRQDQLATDWYSLAEWANGVDFPGPSIDAMNMRRYEWQYLLASQYPTDPDGRGPLQAGDPVGTELMSKQTSVQLVVSGHR